MHRPTVAGFALVLLVSACGGDASAPSTTQAAGEATTTSPPTTATPTTSSTSSTTVATTAAVVTTTTSPASGGAITIASFSFGSPIAVGLGDPVTITNNDAVAHTWTSRDRLFDSGNIRGGDSFEYSFDAPGTYEFFCAIHPTMEGSIVVTE